MSNSLSGELKLREFLTQEKPRIVIVKSTKNKGAVSSRKTWPTLDVKLWEHFDLPTLNDSYGRVLDCIIKVPAADLIRTVSADWCINTDEDIKRLIDWNDRHLHHGLEFGQAAMGLHPGIGLIRKYSAVGETNGTLTGPNIRVDHMIVLNDSPKKHLVMGLKRMASQWNGDILRQYVEQKSKPKASPRPLEQLAHLCKQANTEYGYIQSETDVTVCHFTGKGRLGFTAVLAESIPWTTYGNNLTTDLALWWLGMEALSASAGGAAAAPAAGNNMTNNDVGGIHAGNHGSPAGLFQDPNTPAPSGVTWPEPNDVGEMLHAGHYDLPAGPSQVPNAPTPSEVTWPEWNQHSSFGFSVAPRPSTFDSPSGLFGVPTTPAPSQVSCLLQPTSETDEGPFFGFNPSPTPFGTDSRSWSLAVLNTPTQHPSFGFNSPTPFGVGFSPGQFEITYTPASSGSACLNPIRETNEDPRLGFGASPPALVDDGASAGLFTGPSTPSPAGGSLVGSDFVSEMNGFGSIPFDPLDVGSPVDMRY